VKLDNVKAVVLYVPADVIDTGIGKDADSLALTRQIGWQLADVTARLRPEDEAHQVDAKGFCLADVLRVTHATDLDFHTDKLFVAN
jgi:hypothetical protein